MITNDWRLLLEPSNTLVDNQAVQLQRPYQQLRSLYQELQGAGGAPVANSSLWQLTLEVATVESMQLDYKLRCAAVCAKGSGLGFRLKSPRA